MVAAHLITSITKGEDARIPVGYLMLLLGWTFEDFDAVNDFLAEGSNVQSLIQAISLPASAGGDLVQGLCAFLLGVIYEFSTKDSPLARASFHSVLTKRLDREQFSERLTRLRSHPLVRDFEVSPQKYRPTPGNSLPDVFFDSVFVEFFKDNYSRIGRSIDKAPEFEISVMTNGVQKGISRELVDSLRSQVENKERTLQDAEAKIASLEVTLRSQAAEHGRTYEATAVEVSKLKASINDKERAHDEQLRYVLS
jgi:hypothetical protein